MGELSEWGPGARALLIFACVVVAVAGLRTGAPILLPFALALFLAILSMPVMVSLQRRRVPTGLAILATILVNAAVLGILVLLVMQSVSDFQVEIPRYEARLTNLYNSWLEALDSRGIPAEEFFGGGFITMEAIADVVRDAVGRAVTLASTTFLVVLIMVFILAEAAIFPQKFRAIFRQKEGEAGRFAKVNDEVQEYLLIKTLVSLATGVCIGGFAWIMGLDFPVLLGLIGFVLNYVPTIGSVLAAIPAVVLALIQFGGLGPVIVVAGGYVAINVVFGNLIEPNLLGRRLGLSTLVVILSLIFWAWVWGPVGALLAVPLTMVAKIWLENTEDLRWVAVLLDKEAPKPTDLSPATVDSDERV
jgi:AI-2 transport protein TqsA